MAVKLPPMFTLLHANVSGPNLCCQPAHLMNIMMMMMRLEMVRVLDSEGITDVI